VREGSVVSSRQRLIENIGSLYVLQGVNYILPVVLLPYLVRVLGTEQIGLIAIAQALMQYFVVLTDYGFNLTASRDIAIYKEDSLRVSEIFSTVIFIKLILMLLSFLLLIVMVVSISRFRADWPVYLVSFLSVAGAVLLPVWFFQGLEKMKYITIVNVAGGLISTMAVFALVRDPSDVLLAAGLRAGGVLLTGLLGLYIAWYIAPVRLTLPSLQGVIATLRGGWNVFVSQLSQTLLGTSMVPFLGLFYGNLIVGYFAIAQKLVLAAIGLSIPISNAIYPRVSALFAESQDLAIAFLRKALFFGGLLFLAAGLCLFLGADIAVRLVTGEANSSISVLVKIMAVLPLTVFVDNVYGTQILLPLGMEKQFMKAIVASGLFAVVSALLLVPTSGAVGAALTFVASEVLVLVLLIMYVRRTGIRVGAQIL
jgi:polysaccharide transporter, PST family